MLSGTGNVAPSGSTYKGSRRTWQKWRCLYILRYSKYLKWTAWIHVYHCLSMSQRPGKGFGVFGDWSWRRTSLARCVNSSFCSSSNFEGSGSKPNEPPGSVVALANGPRFQSKCPWLHHATCKLINIKWNSARSHFFSFHFHFRYFRKAPTHCIRKKCRNKLTAWKRSKNCLSRLIALMTPWDLNSQICILGYKPCFVFS